MKKREKKKGGGQGDKRKAQVTQPVSKHYGDLEPDIDIQVVRQCCGIY